MKMHRASKAIHKTHPGNPWDSIKNPSFLQEENCEKEPVRMARNFRLLQQKKMKARARASGSHARALAAWRGQGAKCGLRLTDMAECAIISKKLLQEIFAKEELS